MFRLLKNNVKKKRIYSYLFFMVDFHINTESLFFFVSFDVTFI